MITTLVFIAVPVSVIGIMALLYFQLKNSTKRLEQISPQTIARLMDYLDTLQPYMQRSQLNQHDWGYMSMIIKRILDVDDGDFPFLNDEEERILSEFVYGNRKNNEIFRQTCDELWKRVKKLRSAMDTDISGYGYPSIL
ncbi:MAG: hypothetical protein HQM11_03155 [SAR324 cluster bacterium]|nr:hypothetical protein [SAR324 cluster bacterium]